MFLNETTEQEIQPLGRGVITAETVVPIDESRFWCRRFWCARIGVERHDLGDGYEYCQRRARGAGGMREVGRGENIHDTGYMTGQTVRLHYAVIMTCIITQTT